jgi:hypothetical protein
MDFWKSPLANEAFEIAVRHAPNDPRAAQLVAKQERVRLLSRPQRLGEKLYELVKWMCGQCDEATRLLRVLEDWRGEEWQHQALAKKFAADFMRALLPPPPKPSELQPLVLGIRDDVQHVGDAKGFERELADALRGAETVLASLEAAIEATRVRNVEAKDTLEQAFERARVNMSELAAFQVLLIPTVTTHPALGGRAGTPVPAAAAEGGLSKTADIPEFQDAASQARSTLPPLKKQDDCPKLASVSPSAIETRDTIGPPPSAPEAAILARLDAAVAGLPAVLEGNRAGFERVVGVIESMGARDADDAPAAKLPELKAHDRQAWQLATLHGMTQDKVAAALNKEHGTTYTQGQVSRMIARAKAHADANGLAKKVAGPIDRPRTVDPGRLELGARIDKRKPRPSDMSRANDDDE